MASTEYREPQGTETLSPVAQTGAQDRDFTATLREHGLQLRRTRPEILQINVGKLCNLTCVHCHVNAGPNRKEIITLETIDRIVDWLAGTDIPTVDLTGGAPEMVPGFRHLVERVSELDHVKRIIDRSNLTIFYEDGFRWLPEFLAEKGVEVVASLPCYSAENVNAQRGDGVFDGSIAALQWLNELGYGAEGSGLVLNLVYNPAGAFLPPDEAELQQDYRRELAAHFGIRFNRLYALANLPIARFASYLKRQNRYEDYLTLLRESFNPATVEGLMCRNTLNVSWTGEVFDCDFNQMLDLPAAATGRRKLWDVDPETLDGQPIATGEHCFGCTAGAGSSCGGAIT